MLEKFFVFFVIIIMIKYIHTGTLKIVYLYSSNNVIINCKTYTIFLFIIICSCLVLVIMLIHEPQSLEIIGIPMTIFVLNYSWCQHYSYLSHHISCLRIINFYIWKHNVYQQQLLKVALFYHGAVQFLIYKSSCNTLCICKLS